MHEWLVASAIVEGEGGLLLVRNVRRDGRVDWSTPGGVIEPDEAVLPGLTREVEEETGLRVTEWTGPVYEVHYEAPAMGWRARVEVHRAVAWGGEIGVDDPDGIVTEARWVDADGCGALLTWPPVREPIVEWLMSPFTDGRVFRYTIEGDAPHRARAVRLP